MLKRLLVLLLCVTLLPLTVLAEDGEAGALTLAELQGWAASYLERAAETAPLNDPHDEAAYSEDGYAFIYDFATLYMDQPELTAETKLNALVITDADQPGPRGTAPDQSVEQVLRAFYNENDELQGDAVSAALYVSDTMPTGALWAVMHRDGQRVQLLQYAVHEQLASGGDGYTDAGLIYTVQDGSVAAIRAYGLQSVINETTVRENVGEAQRISELTGYVQYRQSRNGADLEEFSSDDLVFAGIDFLTVTPEDAERTFGPIEADEWMDDDDGMAIRTISFASCTMQFRCDPSGEDVEPISFSVTEDGLEGPRGIRVGDSLASVMSRFRSGEGEVSEDGKKEVLYGMEGEEICGLAEYHDDGSAVLRYTAPAPGSRSVALYAAFEMMELTECTVYIVY